MSKQAAKGMFPKESSDGENGEKVDEGGKFVPNSCCIVRVGNA